MDSDRKERYTRMMDMTDIKMSEEDVIEEMIADFSGEMFNDPKVMYKKYSNMIRVLAKRIYAIIMNRIESVKKQLGPSYI